ncbi:MAG: hypothetical protein AB1631_15740 [Acidobacteriota bacterium]
MATLPAIALTAGARLRATLTSLDDGTTLRFIIAPSEQDRQFGANWEECGVAQASVQFLEYKDTRPEERTIKATFERYSRGNIGQDVEDIYRTLKRFSERAPGRKRAHRLLFTMGVQSFRCVLTNVDFPVDRIAAGGGALRGIDVQISLKELPAR